MTSSERWIERQYRHSVQAMLESVSPTALVKARPGFGQVVHARRGAVVASPVLGSYDPDPDYFFHWYRDSALVIDALRMADDVLAPAAAWRHFADYVDFTLALEHLDGRALVAQPAWRARVTPSFVQYLRPETELAQIHGAEVLGETRVNPDGTLDISRWPRPQHDGAALRALAVLRWLRAAPPSGLPAADRPAAAAGRLLRIDLAYLLERAGGESFDIWQEECGRHYHPMRVAAAALAAGADWLAGEAAPQLATACRAEAERLYRALDEFRDPRTGIYRSRIPASAGRSEKELDMSVIFAVLHAGEAQGPHSVFDPGMLATLDALAASFAALYPINRDLPAGRAPAMGRYAGDRYFSGGAYYFSTLAAAEFCYRAASGAADPRTLVERGDGFLETVRAFTPESGDLSEQFDQRTGAQTSAKKLAWSYAAFITCVAARRHARSRLVPRAGIEPAT